MSRIFYESSSPLFTLYLKMQKKRRLESNNAEIYKTSTAITIIVIGFVKTNSKAEKSINYLISYFLDKLKLSLNIV